MLSIAVLILTLAGAAQAGFDYSRCEKVYGGYGVTVSCEPYWSVVSICSSGKNPDCEDFYTVIECCPEEETTEHMEPRACRTMEGSWGNDLQCEEGLVVQKVCASGRNADCGPNIYQRIECCNDHTLDMDATICNWIHASYGVLLSCSEGQVVAGMCTSGEDPNCNNNYTGVHCCSYAN